MDDPKQFIQNNLDKKPLDSKKFISAACGAVLVMIVWLGTVVFMCVKPESSSQFVSLATIVISFIGAITTSILTGQAVMEFKSMAAIQTIDTNDKEEKKIVSDQNINKNISYSENIKEEGVNGPSFRPYDIDAREDEDYD